MIPAPINTHEVEHEQGPRPSANANAQAGEIAVAGADEFMDVDAETQGKMAVSQLKQMREELDCAEHERLRSLEATRQAQLAAEARKEAFEREERRLVEEERVRREAIIERRKQLEEEETQLRQDELDVAAQLSLRHEQAAQVQSEEEHEAAKLIQGQFRRQQTMAIITGAEAAVEAALDPASSANDATVPVNEVVGPKASPPTKPKAQLALVKSPPAIPRRTMKPAPPQRPSKTNGGPTDPSNVIMRGNPTKLLPSPARPPPMNGSAGRPSPRVKRAKNSPAVHPASPGTSAQTKSAAERPAEPRPGPAHDSVAAKLATMRQELERAEQDKLAADEARRVADAVAAERRTRFEREEKRLMQEERRRREDIDLRKLLIEKEEARLRHEELELQVEQALRVEQDALRSLGSTSPSATKNAGELKFPALAAVERHGFPKH